MRVYIAGPMTGLPENNHQAFQKAMKLLSSEGYGYISPLDIRGDSFPEQFAKDLVAICLEADGVVALPGWEDSKGALVEVATAIRVGKPVWELAEFLLNGPEGKRIGGEEESYGS